MGRIKKGRVGMPKISKNKVERPIVLEDAEKDADQSMPPPPPPSPPAKPTQRRAVPASPGRKQVMAAKSAVKEAKREYLALRRAAAPAKEETASERSDALFQHSTKSRWHARGRRLRTWMACGASSNSFRMQRTGCFLLGGAH